jgi:hypothetical protein
VLSRRAGLRIQLFTGATLVLLGLYLELFLWTRPMLGAFSRVVLSLGLIVTALTPFVGRALPTPLCAGGCVALLTLLAALALVEMTSRWVGFDFRRQEAALKRVPPYYRQPRVPTGEVFYRRRGPQEWTGQVIRTWLQGELGPDIRAYADEPVITVRYDEHGFRNEEPLPDWEIAVAGDSFVELGCLPFEQLSTTILSRLSAKRVLNLGASHAGPFTSLHYLQAYGIASSLKTTVLVFFEGNDIKDIQWEAKALRWHAETGKRGYRRLRPQSSFLQAISDAWLKPTRPVYDPDLQTPMVQYFRSAHGPVPVTISQVAPQVVDLGPSLRDQIDHFFRRYQDFGERHGVATWLAYMPCKGRVLHGRLTVKPSDRDEIALWKPTDLPELIAQLCKRYNIGFVDLTPSLVAAVQKHGRSPYNPMWDTHLNALGAAVVGEEFARRLGAGNRTGASPREPEIMAGSSG